ncbi:FAD-binding and (Fe-S)-binding domain-containing protein [Mycolicibacterium litorale]|uniref:Lactate dehydrogenase n=1 Tax=Mycolicibacterium litorale TaxID=758802 RepID=A0AAD1ILN7_9MYCO|nr:FAD-binding and (Fe-S)-binding domain-containing protein [Mycolicibacterium litorale]MCV7415878.1 FAD-binding oxidoreductase [Mycolicibacterium litorale]TDY09130.1 FAD/FMN-containing dehydrogenase [Mycolicibacterium litorale]BBY17066.1 lactate dehydrogenase [Mycolicibacterium litorale]
MTDCVGELAAMGIDVDTSTRRRAEYSFDASNYRLPPLGVIFPRSVDEVVHTVRVCAAHGVSVTSRGGGTSLAGNAIGRGLVLDFSRHMNAVTSVDESARTACVQPGIVLTELQRHIQSATAGRLTFAPDPSSKSRATVGGAIGNDACGNHSVRYGRTSDHVVALDVVTAAGHRLTATGDGVHATDPTDGSAVAAAAQITADLRALTGEHLAEFRLELARFPRQVSGYHLANLLPENGFRVARALVGTEGTCAVIVGATVSLVPVAPSAMLLCLGYADLVDAARDNSLILRYSPAAIEGIDSLIVDTVRHLRGPDSVVGLPAGNAWLYVDIDGEDRAEVEARGADLVADLQRAGRLVEARVVADPTERASLWRVREDGAGLSARLVDGGESWTGWEDSAVAPDQLADYLVAIKALLAEFGLTGVMYGHFGAGCMHIRIDFDQRTEQGREIMSRFIRRAAELCVRFGGSMSGEHGDGRARSELLSLMYSPAIMAAFSRFKRIWDPLGILNPGSIVDPEPLLDNLSLAGVDGRDWPTSFDLTPSHHVPVAPFVHAVQGCIGVGRCRAPSGGVMCPSFRATGDEKDSTRGRARALQEMARNSPTVADGWRSDDVMESLDLCLSCRACSTDCPVGVDMATYKSEFLDHYYSGRRRPLSHYSLGWLPTWLELITRAAPLVNLLTRGRMGRVAARMGGLTPHRTMPEFASAGRIRRELSAAGTDGDVVLLADTFTRGFRPEVAGAAARVLADAGMSTECRTDACCGLTWISTGQLSKAKQRLAKAAEVLDDGTDRPIVVLEPSCAAALRKDLPELIHTEAARRVARRIRTFAQMVTECAENGWRPHHRLPDEVTVQTHCHEYSVFGAATQRRALEALGVAEVREATGCCGVAGNFGFEPDHYDVSMKVAEQGLVPALRDTSADAPVLTDGFSCHMQVRQLDADRSSQHLAQLLDRSADG